MAFAVHPSFSTRPEITRNLAPTIAAGGNACVPSVNADTARLAATAYAQTTLTCSQTMATYSQAIASCGLAMTAYRVAMANYSQSIRNLLANN
jgi:hypothetical protein